MNVLLLGVIVAFSIWVTSQLRTLIRNYRAACATGLPIVICPYDPDSLSSYPSFHSASRLEKTNEISVRLRCRV